MDIPIYFDDNHPNFHKIFINENHFKDRQIKILHLGAYTGHGTKWMLANSSATCVDVDVWQKPGDNDSIYSETYYSKFYDDSNVENLYDSVVAGLATTKFKGTTEEFFKQNTETFDFIYIDASHRKKEVWHDLQESFKVLNPMGIIGCDDYLWHFGDDPEEIPYYAIKEFAEQNADKIEILIDNFQFWFKKISN